jgi:hypothetical protein
MNNHDGESLRRSRPGSKARHRPGGHGTLPAAHWWATGSVNWAVYSWAMAVSTLVRADRIAGRMAATTPMTAASAT